MEKVYSISLIGGGLVFLGLILLWLMMVLLVKLTADKPQKSVSDNKVEEKEDTDLEYKQKTAAAAVGVVLAMTNASISIPTQEESLSPWQNAYRNIQMNQSNGLSQRKK